MSYAEHLKEDRRLCILRLLKDTDGTANDSVIHSGLELLGHRRHTREETREDIRFLIANGLIADEWYGKVQVCNLTVRGVDVALGKIKVEGVKKPSIGV